METIGFCIIKKDATTGKGIKDNMLDTFLGKVCAIQDRNEHDGGVLVLNPENSALGMFEAEDVEKYFLCSTVGEYILPPNLSEFEKMMYVTKLSTRKGGYNHLLAKMIIMSSLNNGQYEINFLFQKQ